MTSTHEDHTTGSRKLLEARRTQDEFSAAKKEYDETRGKLQRILATWDREEEEQIKTSLQRLDDAYRSFSLKAEGLIDSALKTALKCWDIHSSTALTMNLEDLMMNLADQHSIASPVAGTIEGVSPYYMIIYPNVLTVSHQGP